MGIRTGIDSVSVSDVEAAVLAHGERYLRRVYTADELEACQRADGRLDPQRLATRWAAKEAAIKLLGDLPDAFAWTDVWVDGPTGGRPSIGWADRVHALAEAAGITHTDVSLTHDHTTATAVVVALTSP